MTTATLTAESAAGDDTRGKQFIAMITGRGTTTHNDTTTRFSLTFLGSRGGHRTSVEATPGLYLCRDVTRSGRVSSRAIKITDRCMVVWIDGLDAVATEIDETRALEIAATMPRSQPDWAAIGREAMITVHEGRLTANAHKDDATVGRLATRVGSLGAGEHTMAAIRAARRSEIARLRGESVDLPIELDGGPSDPNHRRAALEAEAAGIRSRLAAIEAELAGIARA